MGGNITDWPVQALAARKPVDWGETVRYYRGAYIEEFWSWEPALMYPERPLEGRQQFVAALSVKDGKLLLVREGSYKGWTLPSGYVWTNGSAVAFACRTVEEKTGLQVRRASFLFDYQSVNRYYRACLLIVEGEVALAKGLSNSKWWDGREEYPIGYSASAIIERAVECGYLRLGLSGGVN